jgi:hypothetical protein
MVKGECKGRREQSVEEIQSGRIEQSGDEQALIHWSGTWDRIEGLVQAAQN